MVGLGHEGLLGKVGQLIVEGGELGASAERAAPQAPTAGGLASGCPTVWVWLPVIAVGPPKGPARKWPFSSKLAPVARPKPTSSPRRCVCCRHPTAQSPPPGVARKKPHPQSPGVLDEKSQPAGLFALVRDQPGPAQQPAGPIRSTKHLQKHSFGRDCWGLLESQGLVRNCWDPTV